MGTKTDVGVLNYAIYKDSKEYMGIAEVAMPDLGYLTQTITGAGIAGEIEAVMAGQLSAMEISLKHIVLTEQTVSLAAPISHKLELREAQQSLVQDGALSFSGMKYVVKFVTKSSSLGTLKSQSTSDPTTTGSVTYLAIYKDGKKLVEVDPLNYVCYIDGTDHLAKVRNALGK